MNRPLAVTAMQAAVLCLSLSACKPETATAPETALPVTADTPAAASETAKPVVDLEQLAQRIVTSAAVKEGDVVWILGHPLDAELMENIAVNARKLGAFPLIEYSSDRLSKRLFFDVPAQYDSQPDALMLKVSDIANVVISLSNGQTQNLFEGADPQRVATRGKANEAVSQSFRKNNVRMVEIGNGLYPTPWRAERLRLSEAELGKTFWEGVNIDYSQLQAQAAQVKSILAGGSELHVTNPNGTDFKVSIQGRPIGVSDGIISAEDLQQGGSALSTYLPAGEVFTTPVPGSGEGKIVSTRDYFRGQPIDNLTVTVSAGKITSLTGSGPGFEGMKAVYDAVGDERKNDFGFIDLGINPNLKLPANSQIGNWVPAGSVTLGVGSNDWAGGNNSVPYGLSFFLPGSTVTLDGKAIVDQGELKP